MMNFRQYSNLVEIDIPEEVTLSTTNFDRAFNSMKNLITCNIPYEKLTNMYMTYYKCDNLTGSPVCGDNVTDMN